MLAGQVLCPQSLAVFRVSDDLPLILTPEVVGSKSGIFGCGPLVERSMVVSGSLRCVFAGTTRLMAGS